MEDGNNSEVEEEKTLKWRFHITTLLNNKQLISWRWTRTFVGKFQGLKHTGYLWLPAAAFKGGCGWLRHCKIHGITVKIVNFFQFYILFWLIGLDTEKFHFQILICCKYISDCTFQVPLSWFCNWVENPAENVKKSKKLVERSMQFYMNFLIYTLTFWYDMMVC